MSGHRNFEELRKGFSSERRSELDAEVAEMQREYVLSRISDDDDISQMRISTLQRIVSAIGGVLKFEVELDGREYPFRFSKQLVSAPV